MKKVKPYYFNKSGKFQQRLITTGKVDQHTAEYKAKLKELGIELPKVAFDKVFLLYCSPWLRLDMALFHLVRAAHKQVIDRIAALCRGTR